MTTKGRARTTATDPYRPSSHYLMHPANKDTADHLNATAGRLAKVLTSADVADALRARHAPTGPFLTPAKREQNWFDWIASRALLGPLPQAATSRPASHH